MRRTHRLLFACCLPALAEAAGAFTTAPPGLIVDDVGRARVFHGVNAVEKVAPYLPVSTETNLEDSLSAEDAAQLQAWGMNVVRLGVMWPGVFPSNKDDVNATYLSEVKTMIETLADYGIVTLVDLHQDVLSPFMCGEGVPDWVYERMMDLEGFDPSGRQGFPAPLRIDIPDNEDDAYPNTTVCMETPFFEYYFSFETQAAFRALYGQQELFDYFGDHWTAVASALKGTRGLLGYELINEPFSAEGQDGTKRVLSDDAILSPLYEDVHTRIRAVDDDTLIFFEPLVTSPYKSLLHMTTDFPEGGPGGADYANRSVFAYHNYCPSEDNGDPADWHLCRVLVHSLWKGFARDLDHLHTGGFLTEFGAVGDDDLSVELLDLQTAHADEMFQSWAYWTYKSFDDITTQNPSTETFFHPDGSLQTAKLAALTRTYAQAIAGVPVSMSFDRETAAFQLVFTASDDIDGASEGTEIYLSKAFHYPNGYDVELSPTEVCLSWNVKEEGDDWAVLEVTHSLDDGTEISVSITPKQ